MNKKRILEYFKEEYEKWDKNSKNYKKNTPPVFGILLKNEKSVFKRKIFNSKNKSKIKNSLKNSNNKNKINFKRKKEIELSKTHAEWIIFNSLKKPIYKDLNQLTLILTIPPCYYCRKFIFNEKYKFFLKLEQIIYISEYEQNSKNYYWKNKDSDIEAFNKLIKKYNLKEKFLISYEETNFYKKEEDENNLLFIKDKFKEYRDSKNRK